MVEGPPAAHMWVLAGGLTPEDATDVYGMKWHEASRKVLIPLGDTGILARDVHSYSPKYRMFGSAKFYRLGEDPKRPSDAVVVVEDILSAIAVNRAGWPVVALLGTNINPGVAAAIASGARVVIGWLDGDKAGDRARTMLIKALRLHPVRVMNIKTELDPKCYHRAQINEWVELRARRWDD